MITVQVHNLINDIAIEGSLRRAIDKQPFAGLNQDAVNWLRRYLNPCDDQQLVVSGIPDRETGRAYIYNKTFMISYNKETFSRFSACFYNKDTKETVSILCERQGDPEELLFIRLPYPGLVGMLVEKGTYKSTNLSTVYSSNYAVKYIFDPNWCRTVSTGDEEGIPDLYTANYGIKFRMMAAGYTLSNNTSKLNLNGNFVTTVFYPHNKQEINPANGSVTEDLTHNIMSGIPLSYDSVTSAGNYKVTRGDEGVYGVLGNFHPEFKYINLDLLDPILSTDTVKYDIQLYEGNLVNTGFGIYNQNIDGSNVSYFCADSIADTHWIIDDSWTWYGMVTAYKGDFSTINLSVKIANLYSILVTPISPLNVSTVIQPPVTPELTNFAGEFTRANLFVYPAAWNSWNKVWSAIKGGWNSFLSGADHAVNTASAVLSILKSGKKKDQGKQKDNISKAPVVVVSTKPKQPKTSMVKKVLRKVLGKKGRGRKK